MSSEKPFWKGKTCGELEGLRVKITWNNGDTMTSTLDMVGNVAHCVSLSPAIRSSSTFVPYSGIKSIELVDDAFRERITDITKVRPGDKVVVKNGNEYTVKKTDSDRMGGQTLCLSIGELADVLQTVGNLITAFDITDEELAQSMDDCLVRNQERGRL